MVDPLRSDAAEMAGLFVEAVLYGVYIITLGFVLVHIFCSDSETGHWRRPSGIRIGTLIVALILAINSTLNLAWGLTRIMQTYIFKIATNGPTWMDLAKPYTVIIQTLTADLFLTYRCWAVYGKSLRAALLPVFLSLGSLGVFIRITIIQSEMNSQFGTVSHQVKAAEALSSLFTAQYALTTAVNVYATFAISYLLWKADYICDPTSSTKPTPNRTQKRTKFQKIIKIIVESALIYTTASAMTFASYKSNAQYITSAVDIIAVGIAFNLITIRLARERARGRREGSESKLTTLKFGSNTNTRPEHSQDEHTDSTNSLHLSSPVSFLEMTTSVSQGEKELV